MGKNKKNVRKFKLPSGKIVKLKLHPFKKIKNIADAPPLIGKIRVSGLFYTRFKYEERVAIIYHELKHKRDNLKIELMYRLTRPYLIFPFFFINRPILHKQEYKADYHAYKNAGKNSTLGMLYKLKKLIEEGTISKKHEKTHPKIDKRIEVIKRK